MGVEVPLVILATSEIFMLKNAWIKPFLNCSRFTSLRLHWVELLQGDVAEWRALFTSAGTEGMS